MHDLANQGRANINANTNFNKGWAKLPVCDETDLLFHCDYEYQQVLCCFWVILLNSSSAQKSGCTLTTEVTVV